MEWGYPERTNRTTVDEEAFDPVKANGIQRLGIRRLPSGGAPMLIGAELWQTNGAPEEWRRVDETTLPQAVQEKLEKLRELGHSVDHIFSAVYCGRTDDASDQHPTSQINFFGFLQARPMLPIGLMYGFGGSELSIDE